MNRVLRVLATTMALAAVTIFALAVVRVVGSSGPTLPPNKQAAISAEVQQDQLAQAKPHPSKGAPVVAATGCPEDPGVTSFGAFQGGPFHGGQNLVSAGHVVVNGASYQVYVGATDANPQQGEIIVIKDGAEDPCAAIAGLIATYQKTFLAPSGVTSLHIVSISGSVLLLADASEKSISFDILTNTYK